jgi:hypothetical protein
MKFSDLSPEDQDLLNTQFPEGLEKQAADEVALFNESYAMGFEKVAVEIADGFDKQAEKEEEEEEEHKLDEEGEKKAAELGAVIERGTFDGLQKLGKERHDDEWYYLRPALETKIAGLKEQAGKAFAHAKAAPGKAFNAVKNYHKGHFGKMMEHGKAVKGAVGMKEKAKHVGKAFGHGAATAAPGAAVASAAGAGGYMAYKHSKKKED